MADQAGFESWAIVELFGHQKIAGRVSEQPLAGTTFLRVDVPETRRSEAYSRMFGAGAIYGILPCSEEQARAILERGYGFAHPEFSAKALPAMAHAGGPERPADATAGDDDDEFDDFDQDDDGEDER